MRSSINSSSNKGFLAIGAKARLSQNPDVRHIMKIITAILAIFLLAPTVSRAHGIHIWIGHENGKDVITINTNVSLQEVQRRFTKLAQIQNDASIFIGVHPKASANTVMELIEVLRDSGMNNVTVYRTHSEREIILPMSLSPTNRTSDLLIPEEKNEGVEQGGPGYPPQGVGSPDP